MHAFVVSLGKFVDSLERWSNLAGTWLIVFLMLLITANVACRFLIGKAILGTYELATLMLVGIVFFTLAYTQKHRGHVRMELVISRLRGTVRHSLEIFALLTCLGICIPLFYQTLLEAIKAVEVKMVTSGVIHWPAWPFKIVVAFGFLLLVIRIAIQLIQQIRLLKNRRKHDST